MNLIAAVDRNHGIGYMGKLLYNIPDDMKFFRDVTSGKIVVMGLATLLSFPCGKPLPNRVNIVLSDVKIPLGGVTVCGSLDELFEALKQYPSDDVYIIGGESVYNQLIDYCEYSYITEIGACSAADKFLHKVFDASAWQKVEESDEREYGGIKYRFCKYKNLAMENGKRKMESGKLRIGT